MEIESVTIPETIPETKKVKISEIPEDIMAIDPQPPETEPKPSLEPAEPPQSHHRLKREADPLEANQKNQASLEQNVFLKSIWKVLRLRTL